MVGKCTDSAGTEFDSAGEALDWCESEVAK